MLNVLKMIEVCKWCAKDLHYTAHNDYAIHLLADKLDFGDSVDALKERYYLGEVGIDVPRSWDIAQSAIEAFGGLLKAEGGVDGDDVLVVLTRRLNTACSTLAYQVEEAKRVLNPMGGVCAVLDEISAVALTVAGLTR